MVPREIRKKVAAVRALQFDLSDLAVLIVNETDPVEKAALMATFSKKKAALARIDL